MTRQGILSLLLAILLITSACSQAPASTSASTSARSAPPQPEPPAVTSTEPDGCEAVAPISQWLSDRAIPLTSLTAGAGFTDLTKLKPALEGVRVVGLGEATHGSSEFFTMKHRMLEFLVTEMGYNVFAMEVGYPEAEAINQYVLGGAGDAAALVRFTKYWPWTTQEVVDLVTWMRSYNQTAPFDQRVRFVGIDVQSMHGAKYLALYLSKVAPGTSTEALTAGFSGTLYDVMEDDSATITQKKALLQGLIDDLAANRDMYVSASSADEYQVAVNMAANLARTYETFSGPGELLDRAQARDRFMGETTLELLEQAGPGAKMVLWAHNGHVADRPALLGGHLRAALGSEYYAAGFAFDHGQLNAITSMTDGRLSQSEVGPPNPGYLDWHFACTGLGNAFVDYRLGERSEAAATWLHTEIDTRVIGAVFDPANPGEFDGKVLPGAFDAMIYIPVIHASVRI